MRKLIVHETDYHGNGYVHYNGEGFHYTYNENGNATAIIQELINIGFISADDVIFLEDDEIYAVLDEALINS